MAHKKCGKCKRWLKLKFSFCPYCGVKLEFTEEEKHKRAVEFDKENRKNRIKTSIINGMIQILLWGLIIAMAAFILVIIEKLGVDITTMT